MNTEWIWIVAAIIFVPQIIVGLVQDSRRAREEPEIYKTAIIDTASEYISESRTRTGSTIGRAAVGGMVGGALGAATGAATARRRTITTNNDRVIFKIWWENGTTCIKEVRRRSKDYELYVRYVGD